ncbi:MAG TPA: ferrochelatase [Actinomycetota bacterium]|nr:ferrochelatase [Actinomycetota bacterium]
MSERVGLLVMAYGTPSGPDDVERYYTDIRGGRPPSPDSLAELKERYAAIGNTFPLARITRDQGEALVSELNRDGSGPEFVLYFGMKHSPPFVPDSVAQMAEEGIDEAIGLVLAPHYSRMSIGSYIERVEKSLPPSGPSFTFVESWHEHPEFVALLMERVRAARSKLTDAQRSNDLLVFTAHSLPTKILEWNDPYPIQLAETAESVSRGLGLDRFTTGWQSAGRTPEPWLGPSLGEVIEQAANVGRTAVVVCPCGFVADHLEILYDIDIEAQEIARREGIPLMRTESMNADPSFIQALASVVRNHLKARQTA